MLSRSFRCPPRAYTHRVCQIRARWRGHRCASNLSLPEIDAKWQKIWQEQGQPSEAPPADGKKSYVLPMFAYPSGSLHMGHLRVYTISDVIARYKRMRGHTVLHPTGWDAFGLPAENAAIERGIDPAVWTEQNIEKMRQQLKSMNTSFNWDAEISTCSPSFYKHTQKLFLKLHEKGLAYQDDALVNWDPVDKTVLANEQVDANGRSWRSGALVEQIKLKQWFFRITKYAPQLFSGLEVLSKDNAWPERVLAQQRNWLGRSDGALIRFRIRGLLSQLSLRPLKSKGRQIEFSSLPKFREHFVTVFTTRPDTIFGVKYLALAVEHPLVASFAKVTPNLQAFLKTISSSTADSKDGYLLPIIARSPIDQLAHIPVYVAPYVHANYGGGAVMGVPAHDDRDLAFWKQHRPDEKIPIVVMPPNSHLDKLLVAPSELAEAHKSRGVLTSLCGKYSGYTSEQFAGRMFYNFDAKIASRMRGVMKRYTTWKLRDWLVSRQRYWGTPIPIVHCKSCGAIPVPEEDLPVVLPKLDSSAKGHKGNPLESVGDWVNCKCPKCFEPAKRETDTMDTFVDSSWYYARFPDAKNAEDFLSKDSAEQMLPVDVYVGGVEHAILHLLYARFVYKVLAEEAVVPLTVKSNVKTPGPVTPITVEKFVASHQEPFTRLIAQGMVHGKTFSDPDTGRFLLPHELSQSGDETVITASGLRPNVSWEKMSKSKHNGVDPAACISKYGADTTRAHILFAAPVSEILQWDEQKIVGIQRWFGRLQRMVDRAEEVGEPHLFGGAGAKSASTAEANLLLLTHDTVQSVTNTFEKDIYSLNTTVSDLIKLTNALDDLDTLKIRPRYYRTIVATLVRMLAPIAPAFAEQCWEDLHAPRHKHISILSAHMWPRTFLTPEGTATLKSMLTEVTCAVQINGKLRFTAMVPKTKEEDRANVPQEEVDRILAKILATDEGRLWLQERNKWDERKKVIVVKGGELVNIVF